MASAAYYNWVHKGKPYKLAQPTKDVQLNIRSHGFTVYDYPNDAHLLAKTPEDHTPFSATGWPKPSAFGIAHAIDIMPKNGNLKELAVMARQIIADKDNKVPGTEWIKYINWTDESGHCFHVSWQPLKSTRSSSDRNHIHLSGRSDMDTARATGYDPYQRMMNPIHPLTEGAPEMMLIKYDESAAVFLSDGVVARWVQNEAELADIQTLATEGYIFMPKTDVRVVGDMKLIGRIMGPVPDPMFADLAEKGSA
jgi:hypothetical protein